MRMALEFAKTGAAKYISHLDLQRAFSRAIRRSGLPVKLSEGFNPHYVVSFASALSLGMESGCECVEMALTEELSADEFLLKIARALPPGLAAKRAVRLRDGAPKLMAALCEAEYEMPVETGREADFERAAADVMNRGEIITVKVTDGRQKTVDIRPLIRFVGVRNGRLVMRLAAAQTGALKADLLLDEIQKQTGVFARCVKRTGLYTVQNGKASDLLDTLKM